MANLEYINQLNEYQKKAVTAGDQYLQVLAGPGSGKTKVLTTRVTWLIKKNNLKPSSIVVVTFTKKAAKEMKERLEQPSLLGAHTNFLRIGTFHRFCCWMIHRHLDWVPLKDGFSIANANKSKHLVNLVFNELKPRLSAYGRSIKPAIYHKLISKAKNKGMDHHRYMATHGEKDFEKDVAMIFSAYEEKLLLLNMVDFDGLLLFGRDLFRNHPQCVNFVKHVLVDEFQDTNTIQYEITWLLTDGGRKALTVVGDPDQSIYGWRNAKKEHFESLGSDYKGIRVVDLRENYRSTANIISGATRVLEIDKSRKPRVHFTKNHSGVPISVLKASSELDEANVVVDEIKRIIKYSNGLINNKDIAILFRMNFLTLNFECALNQAKIPYILCHGTKFFDRKEVKDILGYLRFYHNPRDLTAFLRLINVPKRSLGNASIKKIQSVAAEQNWSLLETLGHIVDGHPAVTSMRIMEKSKVLLKTLLILYNEVEEMMIQKETPGKILRYIVDAIGYMEYLETEYKEKDPESRKANVEELIILANQEEVQQGPEGESGFDGVGRFLEYCSLSSHSQEHKEAKGGHISLSTIHSAKGLEWPCVFIPGCEDGIIPMSRNEIDFEESRVLYVGMTRAKCFLYCTLADERQRWDGSSETKISPYLKDLPGHVHQRRTPAWNKEVRKWTAQMLRLPYVENVDLHLEDAGMTIDRGSGRNYYSGEYDYHDEFDDYGDFYQNEDEDAEYDFYDEFNDYDNFYIDEDDDANFGYLYYDEEYITIEGCSSSTTSGRTTSTTTSSAIIKPKANTIVTQHIKKESSLAATTFVQQKDNFIRNDTIPNQLGQQLIKREVATRPSKSTMYNEKVKKQKTTTH